MNVLISNSTDIFGGGEMYVLWLAQALKARRHNVWVTCEEGHTLHQMCGQKGIPAVPLSFPGPERIWGTIKKVGDIIRKNRIHIVHSNANYDRTCSAFAARFAGAAHVASVHSLHSIQHNITHWIRNKFATDRFIVDGTSIRDLLIQKDRIPSERIAVIHLGISEEGTSRDLGKRRKTRKEMAISDNDVVIGNVARMVPFKGHEVLLDAALAVIRSHSCVKFLLVGDGEIRHELERKVTQLGIEDKVFFAGFREDLQSMYSAFDVYVHPSVDRGGETFPLALLQALASGLPAVATSVGDVPAMVQEGFDGFVVPPKAPGMLAERLSLLVEQEALRTEMGMNSIAHVRSKFTLERMVMEVESVYKNVLRI
jgi:glycosyltransferase involved in cell wall biosynthesis